MDLTRLRGIGSVTARMLGEADIPSVAALEEIGAVEAYRRLRFFNDGLSLNALYALAAGLQDRHWRDLSAQEKEQLRTALTD